MSAKIPLTIPVFFSHLKPLAKRCVIASSLPPASELQMVYLLVFCDHEAFGRNKFITKKLHYFLKKEVPFGFARRMALILHSSPPSREAHMLCWVVFGDHEALRTDLFAIHKI